MQTLLSCTRTFPIYQLVYCCKGLFNRNEQVKKRVGGRGWGRKGWMDERKQDQSFLWLSFIRLFLLAMGFVCQNQNWKSKRFPPFLYIHTYIHTLPTISLSFLPFRIFFFFFPSGGLYSISPLLLKHPHSSFQVLSPFICVSRDAASQLLPIPHKHAPLYAEKKKEKKKKEKKERKKRKKNGQQSCLRCRKFFVIHYPSMGRQEGNNFSVFSSKSHLSIEFHNFPSSMWLFCFPFIGLIIQTCIISIRTPPLTKRKKEKRQWLAVWHLLFIQPRKPSIQMLNGVHIFVNDEKWYSGSLFPCAHHH